MYARAIPEAFDPAAFDEPAAEIARCEIRNGRCSFGPAHLGISAHAAGRYFQRIGTDLTEALLGFYDAFGEDGPHDIAEKIRNLNPNRREITYVHRGAAWLCNLTKINQHGDVDTGHSEEKAISTFIRSVLHVDALSPRQEKGAISLDLNADRNRILREVGEDDPSPQED